MRNVVIHKTTRDVLRYGYEDFTLESVFDPATEEQLAHDFEFKARTRYTYNDVTATFDLRVTPPEESLQKAILRYMDVGHEFVAAFAAENVIMGLNPTQMGQLSQALAPLQMLMDSGSLDLAVGVIATLTPIPDILEQERIDRWTVKLQEVIASL